MSTLYKERPYVNTHNTGTNIIFILILHLLELHTG